MLIIKNLTKKIKKEICMAEEYAKCAMMQKEEDKALADAYYTAANDHLRIMENLHAQVVRIIDTYRKEKGDPPVGMQQIYDYVHEEWMENVAEIKVMLEMYK